MSRSKLKMRFQIRYLFLNQQQYFLIIEYRMETKNSLPEQKPKQKPSLAIAIIACVGGLLLQLIVGSLYQWGIISIYITSFFKLYDPSLESAGTTVASPIMMISCGLTIAIGVKLAKWTHPLLVLVIVQILQAVCMLCASYMTNFWTFVLFYCILFSLAAGAGFMITLVECNKYYPGKKMFINGFVLVGAGLGSVVFGEFAYNFLNKDNYPPINGYYVGSPEVEAIAMKFPTMLKWEALMYLLIGLLGAALMAPVCIRNRINENQQEKRRIQKQLAKEAKMLQANPQAHLEVDIKIDQNEKVQTPLEKKNRLKKQKKQKKHLNRHARKHLHEAHSIMEAMKTKVFWISNFMFFLVATGIFLITNNYKSYAKTTIKDDAFLTFVGVIGGVGNGCSRFLWGLLFSKTGFKTVLLTSTVLGTVVLVTLRFTLVDRGGFTFIIFLLNCVLGGYMVATPTGLQGIYGHNIGSQIYSIYWETFSIGNLIAWVYSSQLTNTIGFDNIIYIVLGMLCLAYPIIIFTKFQGPWENDTTQLEFFVGREIAKRDKKREEEKKAEEAKKENQHQSHEQIHQQTPSPPANEEKVQKISDSTASNVTPAIIELKFSKNYLNNQKKLKAEQRKHSDVSLKVINQKGEARQIEKGETTDQIPPMESAGNLKQEL